MCPIPILSYQLSWWLNQPIWKICVSQFGSSPQGLGWKKKMKPPSQIWLPLLLGFRYGHPMASNVAGKPQEKSGACDRLNLFAHSVILGAPRSSKYKSIPVSLCSAGVRIWSTYCRCRPNSNTSGCVQTPKCWGFLLTAICTTLKKKRHLGPNNYPQTPRIQRRTRYRKITALCCQEL